MVLKIMRVISKTLFFLLMILDIAVFAAIFYLDSTLGEEYKIKKGDVLDFDTSVPITAVYDGVKLSQSGKTNNIGEEFDVQLKAFGIIPFSTVNVEVVDELHVAVLGTPFGMKLYTDGVLVIDLTDVQTKSGNVSPAKKAGIKKGDYIVSIDGKNVYTNEDVSAAVEASAGNKMNFKIKRNGVIKNIEFCAEISEETGSASRPKDPSSAIFLHFIYKTLLYFYMNFT